MTDTKKRVLKRALIAALCTLLALLLVVGGYVAYVLIAYYRIGDKPTFFHKSVVIKYQTNRRNVERQHV